MAAFTCVTRLIQWTLSPIEYLYNTVDISIPKSAYSDGGGGNACLNWTFLMVGVGS